MKIDKTTNLHSKRQRMALRPRAALYVHRLGPGQALGFRAGPNTWTARWKDHAGKQHYQPLGTCDDDFDAASAAAVAWFEKVSGSGASKPKRGSVRVALTAYIASLTDEGRTKSASEHEAMFRRTVDGDVLADTELERLTQEQFRAWRGRVSHGRMPMRAKGKRVQPRAPQTVNRIVRAVAAGLNYAVKHGHVGNPTAWTVPELHVPKSDQRTDPRNLLTPEQRESVKAMCEPIVRDYLRGLELTGARPSEVADLTAKQFDARAGVLVMGAWKGRPVEWRERAVPLSAVGVAFFAERVKLYPVGSLFPGVKGGRMPRRYWAKALRLAKQLMNADKSTRLESLVAYSFRHSRISELLQVGKLDAVTVAAITGTSVAMIAKTYHHQIPRAITPNLDLIDS